MNSLRVLLIESDPDQSRRIASTLTDAKHEVLPTRGFEEASDALQIQKFDAVLLGSPIPANGIAEFAAKLKELEKSQRVSSKIPVLSCSADLKASAWSAVRDTPVDAYLPERFEADAFAEAVSELSRAVTHPGKAAQAASSPELQIFDPEQFQAQVAFDRDLMVEIIDLFLVERVDQINEMRHALETGDYDRLSRVAHTIKGSLSSLHAPQARAHAQELEFAAKHREAQVCRFSLAALEQDLEMLEPPLLALRNSSN